MRQRFRFAGMAGACVVGWVSLIRDAEVIVVYGNPDGLEVVKGGNCVFRGRAVIAKTLDDRGYTQVRPPG